MAVKTIKVDLPAEIFDVEVNIPLIHQVVVAQRAAARQGTHATKTRADVRGGGKKPYKQKGTGRARQGSTRAPQFAGGGVVHGPQPRSYDQRTPKKMKAAALRGLTDRAHVLLVLERADALTWLSLRNAPEVHIVAVDQLNTYDVLAADDVVFTKGAYDVFVGGASAAPAAKTESAAAPATEQATDEPALPAGAKAPLKSGKNPKGYEVQGLQSGTYLVEGDAAYDVSGGDFWFKSAEDAEAAGLTRADEKESDK